MDCRREVGPGGIYAKSVCSLPKQVDKQRAVIFFKALKYETFFTKLPPPNPHTHTSALKVKSDTSDYIFFSYLSHTVHGFKDSLHAVRKYVPAALALIRLQV